MAAFDMIGIRADPDDADDGPDLDVRVLLIDPSPLSRSCLLAGFRESPGISIVACGNVEEFVETAFAKPHVIAIQAAGQDLESQEFGERMERSEEHTSELQSLMRISYAFFCLKKKHTTLTLK